MTTTAEMIVVVCDELKELLLRKNISYGDSVISPMRVFSAVSPYEQICVRIDDKLSRISKADSFEFESMQDTVKDLIGYLVLLVVFHRLQEDNER